MSDTLRKFLTPALRVAALALCLCACRAAAFGQSTDVGAPSPVTGPEIAGVISPLDLGDSRLTRHFYTFGGGQGDVELSIDTNNLEGDIDLFAAAGLRPLAKITLYPGLNSGIARTVFLRRAETLVMRVQARSPNDSDGSYRIRLGGAFIPAVASSAEPAEGTRNAAADAASGAGKKVRRVSSVGARIEEPKVEVAVEFDKPASPAPTPEVAAPTTRPTPARRGAARTSPNARTPARTDTARRGTARGSARTPAANVVPEGAENSSSRPGAEKTEAAESAGSRPTTNARGGRAARANRTRPAPAAPAEPAPPASAAAGLELPGTRLVLELREGGQFVREMSEVRRVTVERGYVVVLLKSGRTERQSLSNVLRMSIEP